MDTPANLPPPLAEQIDRLFDALKSMPELLREGRAYGIAIGLSPALAEQMMRRHGADAATVFHNTWRVDPKASPSAST